MLSMPPSASNRSDPAPPVSASLPAPPRSVSLPVAPISVSLSADPANSADAPVFSTRHPRPAVTAVRTTFLPAVLSRAVPSLRLADVAVQSSTTTASAVAPALTCKISTPRPRSVIASVPPFARMESAPWPAVMVSFPTPPAIVSSPAPPVMVSLRAEPLSLVATPMLTIFQPRPAVTAVRSMASPLVVMLALPSLRLADGDVQEPVAVALTVAPVVTCTTSEPFPRSVKVSTPVSMMMVSSPPPAVIRSLPPAPRSVSFPAAAVMVSVSIDPMRAAPLPVF